MLIGPPVCSRKHSDVCVFSQHHLEIFVAGKLPLLCRKSSVVSNILSTAGQSLNILIIVSVLFSQLIYETWIRVDYWFHPTEHFRVCKSGVSLSYPLSVPWLSSFSVSMQILYSEIIFAYLQWSKFNWFRRNKCRKRSFEIKE